MTTISASRLIRWLKRRRRNVLVPFLLNVAAGLLVWYFQTIGNPPAPLPPTRSASIRITRIPTRLPKGQSTPSEWIAGQVNGLNEYESYRIVIYSYTNQWYVQPTVLEPKTGITPEGKWQSYIQGGVYYAALLVKKEINLPPESQTLPTDDAVTWEVQTGKADLLSFGVAFIVTNGLYLLALTLVLRRKAYLNLKENPNRV